MDGTLVDTEPYWMQAEIEMFAEFGRTWTHSDALQVVGLGLWESAAIFQKHGVELDADAIVNRLTDRVQQQLRTSGVPWRPGAQELLRSVRDAGVPCALVTMSVRRMAEQVTESIPFDAFSALVTGDIVERPKPFPDPYLAGADVLGVDIARCVAIEDSVSGLTSATSAGAAAIGVPHMVALPEEDGHVIWPTLAGRTVDDLSDVLAAVGAAR
jgi:HAD superfamily hydrolase (TIGR01509 family)